MILDEIRDGGVTYPIMLTLRQKGDITVNLVLFDIGYAISTYRGPNNTNYHIRFMHTDDEISITHWSATGNFKNDMTFGLCRQMGGYIFDKNTICKNGELIREIK